MAMDDLDKSIRELESRLSEHGFDTPYLPAEQLAGASTSTGRTYRPGTGRLEKEADYADLDMNTPATGRDLLRNRPRSTSMRKKVSYQPDDLPADDKYNLRRYLSDTQQKPIASSERGTQRNLYTPVEQPRDILDHDRVADGITYRKKPVVKLSQKQDSSTGGDTGKQRSFFKPATYDGISSWSDYKTHFKACAKLGKWSDEDKALYLAVSLRGQAQAVLGDLPDGSQIKYDELITALDDRFAPQNQMELYRVQLRERRQRATESLPELGQNIRRLTNLAYPTAPQDVKETLAKEQFIDALIDSDMRLRIKQARPVTLNEAIRHAVELEAFVKAEGKAREMKGYLCPIELDNRNEKTELKQILDAMGTIQETVKQLQTDLATVKKESVRPKQEFVPRHQNAPNTPMRQAKSEVECFYCKKRGHMKRECRKWKRDNEQAKHNQGRPTQQKEYNSHMKAGDAGMYIEACVGDLKWRALVDTGATVSIISVKVYDILIQKDKLPLRPVKKEILSANNQPLTVLGKTNIMISIGNQIYEQEVVVADVTIEGVLGLDFMTRHKCIVSLTQSSLIIGEQTVPMQQLGLFGCYKIAVGETINLPPRTEVIVAGKLCTNKDEQCPEGIGIVEAGENFMSSERGLVARTLVECKADHKCPMCPFRTHDMDFMREHLKDCGISKIIKRYPCDKCDYEGNTLALLAKHKKVHVVMASDTESEDTWRKSDPGQLIDVDEPSEVVDPTKRKTTQPSVITSKRRIIMTEPQATSSNVPAVEHRECGTQTLTYPCERKIEKTTRWWEAGKEIVVREVTKEEIQGLFKN